MSPKFAKLCSLSVFSAIKSERKKRVLKSLQDQKQSSKKKKKGMEQDGGEGGEEGVGSQEVEERMREQD